MGAKIKNTRFVRVKYAQIIIILIKHNYDTSSSFVFTAFFLLINAQAPHGFISDEPTSRIQKIMKYHLFHHLKSYFIIATTISLCINNKPSLGSRLPGYGRVPNIPVSIAHKSVLSTIGAKEEVLLDVSVIARSNLISSSAGNIRKMIGREFKSWMFWGLRIAFIAAVISNIPMGLMGQITEENAAMMKLGILTAITVVLMSSEFSVTRSENIAESIATAGGDFKSVGYIFAAVWLISIAARTRYGKVEN